MRFLKLLLEKPHLLLGLPQFQMRRNPRQHFFMLQRLSNIIRSARQKAFDFINRIGQRGHEDDRNVGGRRIFFEPAADFQSVNARHHDVQQHQIRIDLIKLLERAFPALRDGHLEPGFLQIFE